MPDLDTDVLAARAHDLGYDAGRSAATWRDTFDCAEVALRCLRLHDDGDPMWDHEFGSDHDPLSGDDTDAPTPQSIARDLGVDDQAAPQVHDLICEEYESGFGVGYSAHILAAAESAIAADVLRRTDEGDDVGLRDRTVAADYARRHDTTLAAELRAALGLPGLAATPTPPAPGLAPPCPTAPSHAPPPPR